MAHPMIISPARGPLRGTIRPPGSKSITNRALVCGALAKGRSTLHGAPAGEDTQVMVDALGQLGVAVHRASGDANLQIAGCAGRIPAEQADLYVANSGTTIRFLTAVVSLGSGMFRLHGIPRMHERPIQDLLDALNQLGSDARSEARDGCPPVVVRAGGLPGGSTKIRGDVSSQFLSGLLMASPLAKRDVSIEVEGHMVSQPYVAMTCRVMQHFGVHVIVERPSEPWRLRVPAPQQYTAGRYDIEPDASAASYFWAAAAITGGQVTVPGLARDALQGDVQFCDILGKMGCSVRYDGDGITVTGAALTGVHAVMTDISDTVQTLAAVALFADGATTISGVGHIRHKETDRIGNLATELRKLGATIDTRDDGMTIVPGRLRAATIDTYNDHRMAMSLALVGLRQPGVAIVDPDCTRKTYPNYFEDLARLSALVH